MPVKHTLVVPCYNEEDNVAAFFDAACAAMEGYTDAFELVFVNDGSADRTAERLDALYAAHPDRRITVVHFSRNFGKEAAMYAGLSAARGDYVTIIDADLQQRPEVAVEMGRLLDGDASCDMVAAYPAHRQDGFFLRWCKTAFYRVINRMTDVEFIPDASDFRTLRRRVVDALLELPEYHRFSKGLFSFVGFRSRSIPYEVQERFSGNTKWSFVKLLRYALDGIMAYTDLPLRLPLFLGGGLCAVGAAGLLAALIVHLAAGVTVAMWAIAALLVLLCGLILFALGVQGTYIGKIHTQVKHRPVYIAREIRTYPSE